MTGWWFLATLSLCGMQSEPGIREGTVEGAIEAGHIPGSWSFSRGFEEASSAFKYEKADDRFVVDDRVNAPDFDVHSLPVLVRLDLALARHARAGTPDSTPRHDLQLEIAESLAVTPWFLHRYARPPERVEAWRRAFPESRPDITVPYSPTPDIASLVAAARFPVPEMGVELQGIRFSPDDIKTIHAIAMLGNWDGRCYGSSRLTRDEALALRSLLDSENARVYSGTLEEVNPPFISKGLDAYRRLYGREAPTVWSTANRYVAEWIRNETERSLVGVDPATFHQALDQDLKKYGVPVAIDLKRFQGEEFALVNGFTSQLGTPRDERGKRIYPVRTTLSLAGSDRRPTFEYTLTVDPDYPYRAESGEWTGSSRENHPDGLFSNIRPHDDMMRLTAADHEARVRRQWDALADVAHIGTLYAPYLERARNGNLLPLLAALAGPVPQPGSDLESEITRRFILKSIVPFEDRRAGLRLIEAVQTLVASGRPDVPESGIRTIIQRMPGQGR